MDLQEKYDELDNIITTLDSLIEDITDQNYIDQLRETLYQAQDEIEEIEPLLQEKYDREERELEYEYERSVI